MARIHGLGFKLGQKSALLQPRPRLGLACFRRGLAVAIVALANTVVALLVFLLPTLSF